MPAKLLKVEELDHRHEDGKDITLVWFGGTSIGLLVNDGNEDTSYVLDIPPEKALDAFQHPARYMDNDRTSHG